MYETLMTVSGTLITQVNRRRMPDGTTVVSFRVASNERRYDRASESWVDGDTLYVSVTCWRKLAENVHASFAVGDPIIVYGRVYTRSYEKDGRRLSVTELEASAVGPDLAKCTAAITRTKRANVGEEPLSRTSATDGEDTGDDWPTAVRDFPPSEDSALLQDEPVDVHVTAGAVPAAAS